MLPVLFMIALTVGIALFIAYPLLTAPRSERTSSQDREAVDLLVRRDQLFHDIRETELDYKTGKLSEQDYEANITQLKTEAAEVIAQLESGTAQGASTPAPTSPNADASGDPDVEALIAAARKRRAPRAEDQAQGRVACPSCGASNPQEAQFCMKCGTALAASAKETS
jgi:cytochrome c-type biogenesis protein CcmI